MRPGARSSPNSPPTPPSAPSSWPVASAPVRRSTVSPSTAAFAGCWEPCCRRRPVSGPSCCRNARTGSCRPAPRPWCGRSGRPTRRSGPPPAVLRGFGDCCGACRCDATTSCCWPPSTRTVVRCGRRPRRSSGPARDCRSGRPPPWRSPCTAARTRVPWSPCRCWPDTRPTLTSAPAPGPASCRRTASACRGCGRPSWSSCCTGRAKSRCGCRTVRRPNRPAPPTSPS